MFKQLILIIYLLSSCNTEDKRELITGGSLKYWDLFNNESNRFVGAYSFSVNGTCYYYVYMSGKKVKFIMGDVIYSETWEMDKNILTFYSFSYNILKLTKDTMVLRSISQMDTILLVESSLVKNK